MNKDEALRRALATEEFVTTASASTVRSQPCLFCGERLLNDISPDPIGTSEGPRYVHWQCGLREVVGGIGHLIAHDHWCGPQGDPDAGLTYRQSAMLAAAYVAVVGIDGEDIVTPPSQD